MPAPGRPRWSKRAASGAASLLPGAGGPSVAVQRIGFIPACNKSDKRASPGWEMIFADATNRRALFGRLRDRFAGTPAIEIGERALADRALPCDGLRGAAQALAVGAAGRRDERRK